MITQKKYNIFLSILFLGMGFFISTQKVSAYLQTSQNGYLYFIGGTGSLNFNNGSDTAISNSSTNNGIGFYASTTLGSMTSITSITLTIRNAIGSTSDAYINANCYDGTGVHSQSSNTVSGITDSDWQDITFTFSSLTCDSSTFTYLRFNLFGTSGQTLLVQASNSATSAGKGITYYQPSPGSDAENPNYILKVGINSTLSSLSFINPPDGSTQIESNTFIFTGNCNQIGSNRLALTELGASIENLPDEDFTIDCDSDGTWNTTAPLTLGSHTYYVVDIQYKTAVNSDPDAFTNYVGFTNSTGAQSIESQGTWLKLIYPKNCGEYNYCNNLQEDASFPLRFSYNVPFDLLSATSSLQTYNDPNRAKFKYYSCLDLSYKLADCTLISENTNGNLDAGNYGTIEYTGISSTTPHYYKLTVYSVADNYNAPQFTLNFALKVGSIPELSEPAALPPQRMDCGVLDWICGLFIPRNGFFSDRMNQIQLAFQYKKPFYYLLYLKDQMQYYSDSVDISTSSPNNLLDLDIPVGGETIPFVGPDMNDPTFQNIWTPMRKFMEYAGWFGLLWYLFNRGRGMFRRATP